MELELSSRNGKTGKLVCRNRKCGILGRNIRSYLRLARTACAILGRSRHVGSFPPPLREARIFPLIKNLAKASWFGTLRV